MKVLGSLILVAWLALYMGFGMPSVCASLPSKVRVRLFEAKPNLQSVFLRGPFAIAVSRQAFLSGRVIYFRDARNFKISCGATGGHGGNNAGLELTDGRSKKVLLGSNQFYIEGLGRALQLEINEQGRNEYGRGEAGHKELRAYKGSLYLGCERGQLIVENELPSKEYIACVVASESLPGAELEALKAQSVLSQTRLYLHVKDKGGQGSLGDSTKSEVYKGSAALSGPVLEAVRQTFGQILSYKQQPAQVFYHSTCAGGTSPINVLLPKQDPLRFPYLQGVKCHFCHDSNFYNSMDSIIDSQQASLHRELFPCEIVGVDKQGRPLKIKTADGIVFGFNYWLLLGQNYGWGKVPGMRFKITSLKRGGFKISSTGAGHGVGLCQWGSNQLAKEGKSYKGILEYYFPGTSLLLL